MKCIMRREKYKMWEAPSVLAEAQRRAETYKNYVDSSKSYLNVHKQGIFPCEMTLTQFIKQYKEENNIGGRFNIDKYKNANNGTYVFCQHIFTASNEFFMSTTRKEQLEYFGECIEFWKQTHKDCPIISIDVHYDETTPHLHISWLPIYHDTEKDKKSFNVSKIEQGKNYLAEHQQDFLSYMQDRYNFADFEHGKKYDSLPEFKAKQDKLNELETLIDERENKLYSSDYKQIECKPILLNNAEVKVNKEELAIANSQLKDMAIMQDEIIKLNEENNRLFDMVNMQLDYKDSYYKLYEKYIELKKAYNHITSVLKKLNIFDKVMSFAKQKDIEKDKNNIR